MSAYRLNHCVPDFGRHGSYPPRFGWLSKVHAAVRSGQDSARYGSCLMSATTQEVVGEQAKTQSDHQSCA